MQDAKTNGKDTATSSDKKALERLQSPDDLDKYLRLTSPGIWISIIACVAILLGIGAWAIFGSVSDHISLKGAAGVDGIICFVDSDTALRINEGDFAYVDGVLERVTYVDETAYDANIYKQEGLTDLEIHRMVGDVKMIHPVVISDSQNLELKTAVQVTITVEQKTPLAMIFGKK